MRCRTFYWNRLQGSVRWRSTQTHLQRAILCQTECEWCEAKEPPHFWESSQSHLAVWKVSAAQLSVRMPAGHPLRTGCGVSATKHPVGSVVLGSWIYVGIAVLSHSASLCRALANCLKPLEVWQTSILRCLSARTLYGLRKHRLDFSPAPVLLFPKAAKYPIRGPSSVFS